MDYYDETALSNSGTYYWRVRGLDSFGRPIGVFSDAEASLRSILLLVSMQLLSAIALPMAVERLLIHPLI